jgi:hypothetical protein
VDQPDNTTRPARGRPRRPRGPVNHRVTLDSPDSIGGGRQLPWSPDPQAPGAWTCLCGSTGNGQTAATWHLEDKATAAFARIDNHRAVAFAQVSDMTAAARAAITILAGNAHWYAHPLVRRHMRPFYDGWGCLAVSVNWTSLAAAHLPGDPDDHLVLQVAASIAGVSVPLALDHLLMLGEGDARNIRAALLRLLPVGEEH